MGVHAQLLAAGRVQLPADGPQAAPPPDSTCPPPTLPHLLYWGKPAPPQPPTPLFFTPPMAMIKPLGRVTREGYQRGDDMGSMISLPVRWL